MRTFFILTLIIVHHKFGIIDSNLVYPKLRKFIHLPGYFALASNKNNLPSNTSYIPPVVLRIQQYNVLADGLAGLRPDLGQYSRVDKQILDFERRKGQLLKEIIQYNADIVTLQECDHYHDYFLPELSKRGYVGYFAPKPTSACLEVSPNSDGCALFIKYEKLSVVSIETKTLALSTAELGDGGEVLEDDKNIKAQNQVAIIALCMLKDQNSQFRDNELSPPGIIIVTTHLKSSKTATGERHRAKGIQQILNQVNSIYQSLEDRGKSPAVIITGVLNAVPEVSLTETFSTVSSSPVYSISDSPSNQTTALYQHSYSSPTQSTSAPKTYEPLTYALVKSNLLCLRSVYNDDVPLSPEKLSSTSFYTTWKARNDFSLPTSERITRRAVDYIYYSTYRKGIYKNSIKDRTGLNQLPVTVSSTDQLGLSYLLRFVVYFFGALIPLSSTLSTTLDNYDKAFLFIFTSMCLWIFENIAEGSMFKPQIAPNAKINDEDSEHVHNINVSGATMSSSSSDGLVSDESLPTSSMSKYKENSKQNFGNNGSVLSSVGSLSMQILPLKKYGRPGFQAVSALDVFSDNEIGQTLIPSEFYPSDHISLVADLQLLW